MLNTSDRELMISSSSDAWTLGSYYRWEICVSMFLKSPLSESRSDEIVRIVSIVIMALELPSRTHLRHASVTHVTAR